MVFFILIILPPLLKLVCLNTLNVLSIFKYIQMFRIPASTDTNSNSGDTDSHVSSGTSVL